MLTNCIRTERDNHMATHTVANEGRLLEGGVGSFEDEYSDVSLWLEGRLDHEATHCFNRVTNTSRLG